jgi:hypothetical protein
MCGFPWTAYGASQAFYFRKAEKENTSGGIKYETVMKEYETNDCDPLYDEVVDNGVG